VSVEARPEGGVRINDRIDRRTATVRADRTVDPEPVVDHPFEYPQDVAVSITAGHLELLPIGACILHGPTTATELKEGDEKSLPDGRSVLEVSGPMKMYVELTGPYTVEFDGEELDVDLERPGAVVVGARTFHERPPTTVTTTTDPVDLMAAVSTFGSELKTRTSKRSYPTLRGHPPRLVVGRERSIPPGLERADASVQVEVPRSLDHVLAVAPMAYYLGAPVEPADEPALVVDGDRYRLASGAGFEATVERTLKRTLFMDCLVRTTYPRPELLAERERIADVLDVNLATLKGRPFHERLPRYMQVPYETIEPHFPDWRTVAHVQPTRAGIEALPFLANDLAIVRVPDRATGAEDQRTWESTDDSDARGAETAGVSDGTVDGVADTHHVVRPPTTEAVGQAWVGPGVPIGASKVLPTAYHNRLDRDRREDGTVEVAVVCNDEEMFEEGDAAKDAYGTNQQLPFDVAFHYAASTAELADVFESNLDYVHYVGHVGADGFRCPDGALDVDSVDRVAVDIAFLNACQSYEQGCKLVLQGGIASVVTFDDVLDEGALRIGKTMARLLNQGFPIDRALSIARGRSIVGSQYLVVGDHDADIAQSGTHIPWVTRTESAGDDAYRVQVSPYPTKSSGMGALFYPSIGGDSAGHLVPKRLPPVTVSAERFRNYLQAVSMPVVLDGDVTWSEDAVERL
jgi:hypothetical protein